MVISKMVELLNLPVKLVMCPILRDPDGLAMSSRNIHLSATERQQALVLSKALFWLKDNFNKATSPHCRNRQPILSKQQEGVELEYLEIADGETLHPANQNTKTFVALVAARVGKTRLIDNVIL
jgi:pantoate--beta-alanine ligase